MELNKNSECFIIHGALECVCWGYPPNSGGGGGGGGEAIFLACHIENKQPSLENR
jgi:hypothetical protein